ncbi:hypothetical protein KZX45_15030 [Georgenia sp. EYE_87]|uniref:hypothetical protein n=1 Tax=Georgenia sp. EYE_87 TaxID=2853448 RepID=UPI0020045498|nr:hypothetical protein [Georgenia sp. EYE_87]MCK6211860.1 hypothetical protein [Georgenia sp. EYE_87]
MSRDRAGTAWETDFVVELRLLDVPGHHIGDALEQVRSHCAESGEDAGTAFGDPAEYARSLGLPAQDVRFAGMLLGTAGGLVGMFLALWGFTSWLDGEPVAITLGRLVAAVALVLAAPLLLRYLRTVLERPWLAVAAMALGLSTVVAAPVVLTVALAQLPAPAVTVAGLGLVVGTALWEHLGGEPADPVVSPVGDGRRPVRAAAATWLLPVGTVVLMGLAWALEALS